MLAEIASAALRGVDAYRVRVEVDVGSGLPSFSVVGLPEGAVKEGRERVLTALRNAGLEAPPARITVNLAPADVRKEGSALDLPIALGLLCGTERVRPERVEGWAFVGELGLDGSLRPIRGALPVAAGCRAAGLEGVVVPRANAPEAAVVRGIDVVGAGSLVELLAHLRGEERIPPTVVFPRDLLQNGSGSAPDLADVRGQEQVKRALEVAAAGGHNLLMTGPPGAGKTMLARRLPGILPPLSVGEAVETTKIHSVAGRLEDGASLVVRRPFRAPHHTISDAGLIGGGSHPKPGEVSLAHNGVLFLDELPEFRRNVLEALRQPLEDGAVTIVRARYAVRYPSRFMLVAAMNPCPCGHYGDPRRECACSPAQVHRYRSRISGPLLDRIDLHVAVPAVDVEALRGEPRGEGSDAVRERVRAARELQLERFGEVDGLYVNARMGPREVRRHARPSPEAERLLARAVDRLGLSARAYHRVLRIARTIADLAGEDDVGAAHVAEAIQYRTVDRRG